MKIHIDTDVDQVVILQKKTSFQFIISEILIYLTQIMLFFWVTFLVSGSLNDEIRLVKYVESKINENSLSEVGYIILATLLVLGIIFFIAKAAPATGWLDELADDVFLSISRTIYFFGSSVTGAILAIALFSYLNPDKNNATPAIWLGLSLVFGLGAFLYGCVASYVIRYKKYIAKNPNKPIHPTAKASAD